MLYYFDSEEVAKRIQYFREKLLTRSAEQVVRATIISGDCFVFSPEKYTDLRSEIANHFNLEHSNDVLVVGSAKLGFSIAPHKRYQPFHDGSDIDVAIVSTRLFDTFWERAFAYANSGAYWPRKGKFIGYLFRGWIRPDKLPAVLAADWFEYFRALTQTETYGPYKNVARTSFISCRFAPSITTPSGTP